MKKVDRISNEKIGIAIIISILSFLLLIFRFFDMSTTILLIIVLFLFFYFDEEKLVKKCYIEVGKKIYDLHPNLRNMPSDQVIDFIRDLDNVKRQEIIDILAEKIDG